MKKIKLRNPVARSPLLRKGGVHSAPKRQRIQEPRLQDAILEWENEHVSLRENMRAGSF